MSDVNLSGLWHGVFSYPRDLPPENFTVTLIDRGGSLAGETEETGNDGRACTGLIQGKRTGNAVTFVKTYDDRHGWPIRYAGTLDVEASEIAGTWRIDDQWSGSFVMVRSPPVAATVERHHEGTVS
jgi:hypothetical protein